MSGTRTVSSVFACMVVMALPGCMAKRTYDGAPRAKLSSFNIGKFKPLDGDPAWDQLQVSLMKPNTSLATVSQTYALADFANGQAEGVSLSVPQGSYTIAMDYMGSDGSLLYNVCKYNRDRTYEINTPDFTTSLPICKVASPQPSGTVPVTPMSNVTLIPQPGESPSGSQAQGAPTTQQAQLKSPGCAVSNPETGVKTVSLNVSGVNRTMIRVVSPTYKNTNAYALVIGFHGYGLNGNSPRVDHKWPVIEEKGKDQAIFIYPNALGGSWNGFGTSNDLPFFDAIVESTAAQYCIDKNRVFVHGFSNGAFFVNSLVAARSQAIRGVISVAGGGTGTKKPAMVIHGKSDGTVSFAQAPSLINSYASVNGCTTPPNLDAVANDTCKLLDGCPKDFPVWYCTWGGGHHWPEFTLPTVWQFISSMN